MRELRCKHSVKNSTIEYECQVIIGLTVTADSPTTTTLETIRPTTSIVVSRGLMTGANKSTFKHSEIADCERPSRHLLRREPMAPSSLNEIARVIEDLGK